MHDRADYKTGWAMEQDYEAKEKKRKEREALGEWADDQEDADKEDEEYLVRVNLQRCWVSKTESFL